MPVLKGNGTAFGSAARALDAVERWYDVTAIRMTSRTPMMIATDLGLIVMALPVLSIVF
jgi:hypothetical protein